MERKLTGKANHVWKDGGITTLDIHEEFDSVTSYITIANAGGFIIVNSIEQWKQIDALVRMAFDNLE